MTIKTKIIGFKLKPISLILLTSVLNACSEPKNDGIPNDYASNSASITVAGDVIDGPIVNGIIELRDRDNVIINSSKTDTKGHYALTIPDSAKFPLLATITEGTDIVTEQPLIFSLNSVIIEDIQTTSNKTININTFSSLITLSTQLFPNHSAGEISQAVKNILNGMSFGLDMNINPVSTPTSKDNVADIIKANQAAIEFMKRLSHAAEKSLTKTMKAVVEDLSDGQIDGQVAAGIVKTQLTERISQLAQLIQKQVIEELKQNQLEIRDEEGNVLFLGVEFAQQMNNAIKINQPEADANQTVEKVLPTEKLEAELALVIEGIYGFDESLFKQAGVSVGPVITLQGAQQINLIQGETYIELGAVAYHGVEGYIQPIISGNVDIDTIGRYVVTYTAVGSLGNTSIATRVINILDPVLDVVDESNNFSEQNTTLPILDSAEIDPTIVVFDLIEGVSSNHSGREFDSSVSYDIYIQVNSGSTINNIPEEESDTWGVWHAWDRLSSDDHIIFVGSDGIILGEENMPVVKYAQFENTYFLKSATFTAIALNFNGNFTRVVDDYYSSAILGDNVLVTHSINQIPQVNLMQMLPQRPETIWSNQGLL